MNDEHRYAILIGTSEFGPESGLAKLYCPPNDVDDVAELITSAETGLFAREDVSKLVNRPHYEITRHINIRAKRSNADDIIFIYYSGHGKQDMAGRLYLASSNTTADALEATSVPLDLLRTILDSCASRKIIIVLDCCFSGSAGAAFMRSSADDQMKQFARAQGTYLLTASTRIQIAQEKDGERNAVFTKHFIAGIRTGRADVNGDGYITMDELFGYVHTHVSLEVPQEPERYFFGARGDIAFARAGSIPTGAQPPAVPAERYRRLGPLRTEVVWSKAPAEGVCVSLAVSPLGRFCAGGFENGAVCVLRVATGEAILQQQDEEGDPIWSVAFSSSGRHVAWVTAGPRITICDLATDTRETIPVPDVSRLLEVSFISSTCLVACASEGSLNLVNVVDHSVVQHPLLGGSVVSMACDAAGGFVCVGANPGRISLFNAETESFSFDMEVDWPRPSSISFAATGSAIVCGSPDGRIRVLDTERRTLVSEFGNFAGAVSGLAFSGDGSLLYAADGTRTISIIEAESWRPLTEVLLPGPVSSLRSVPTDGGMVAGCSDGTVHRIRQLRGIMTKAFSAVPEVVSG